MIFAAVLLMLHKARSESYMFCEHGRLASGIVYLYKGDFFPFHVNPPLVSLAAAAPAVLCGVQPPNLRLLEITSLMRIESRLGESFVKNNPNHFRLVFAGRAVCIFLNVAGLLFLARYAHRLYRGSSPFLILCLILFLPAFIGYGTTVCSDAVSGIFGAVAAAFFADWLRKPDRSRMISAGVALGLAELTKFTLILFYPLFLLMAIFIPPGSRKKDQASFRRRFAQFAGICAISLGVINFGYLFEGTGTPLRNFRFQTKLLGNIDSTANTRAVGNRFNGSGNRFETALGYLPMPLPVNYIQGIDTQRLDFERGFPSYLRGRWSDHGWRYYYIYALLLKTPLGTIGIFLLAVVCSLFLKGYNTSWREETAVLLPGVALLLFVSSQTGFSDHYRYVIPAIPFFIVWTSKVGRAFTPEMKSRYLRSSRAVRWLTVFFLVWSLGSSLWVYPHSIAYYNELAAVIPTPEGRNALRPESGKRKVREKVRDALNAGPLGGPRHLLGSNTDWGQDIFGLERWCKAHPEIKEIKTALSGSFPIEETEIPSSGFPPLATEPGWYALSVNYLYERQKEYDYFLNIRPSAVIGYTIYVYHLTAKDAESAGSVQN